MMVVGLFWDQSCETEKCVHEISPRGTTHTWSFLTRTIPIDGVLRVVEFDASQAVMCKVCGCVVGRMFDPRNLPSTDDGDPDELELCQ